MERHAPIVAIDYGYRIIGWPIAKFQTRYKTSCDTSASSANARDGEGKVRKERRGKGLSRSDRGIRYVEHNQFSWRLNCADSFGHQGISRWFPDHVVCKLFASLTVFKICIRVFHTIPDPGSKGRVSVNDGKGSCASVEV